MISDVEAIEDGKIVKVSEGYAIKEGLPIIRKQGLNLSFRKESEDSKTTLERIGFDGLRKPLNWRDKKEIRGLVNNFHWNISRRRREMNLNRLQVAKGIGEPEEVVKALENGILIGGDVGLINKIEDFMGINLRKETDNFSQNMRLLIENAQKKDEDLKKDKNLKRLDDNLSGDEIILLD